MTGPFNAFLIELGAACVTTRPTAERFSAGSYEAWLARLVWIAALVWVGNRCTATQLVCRTTGEPQRFDVLIIDSRRKTGIRRATAVATLGCGRTRRWFLIGQALPAPRLVLDLLAVLGRGVLGRRQGDEAASAEQEAAQGAAARAGLGERPGQGIEACCVHGAVLSEWDAHDRISIHRCPSR